MAPHFNTEIKELYQTIIQLQTIEDCQAFFDDLCTIKEIDAMAQRLACAKLLIDGETYENIIQKTDISSATLSRVSKCVKYGDGYSKFLKK